MRPQTFKNGNKPSLKNGSTPFKQILVDPLLFWINSPMDDNSEWEGNKLIKKYLIIIDDEGNYNPRNYKIITWLVNRKIAKQGELGFPSVKSKKLRRSTSIEAWI